MEKGKGKNGKGRGGALSGDDARLWRDFTRDIAPLEPGKEALSQDDESGLNGPAAAQQKKAAASAAPGSNLARKAGGAPVSDHPPQLDLRTDMRLRRGQMPIDARLDLHGHSQEQAHMMLNRFVMESYRWGCRCVLVITGKGRGGKAASDAYAPNLEPGILKQKLPQWLSMDPLRALVLKIHPASPKHGGGGAFYIYLKRQRGD